ADDQSATGISAAPSGARKIELRGLFKSYASKRGRITALENIDLGIAENEFITLVGPSGCGKSTLLKIVGGLIRPSRGALFIDGERRTSPSREVGIVFQEAVLLQWRNVLDNVMLPVEILGLDRGTSRQRAFDLLKLVGLEGFEKRYPRE